MLTGGKVSRSTDGGTTWGAAVQLQTYAHDFACNGGGPFGLTPMTQDPTAIAWASDTTAYLSANLQGVLQKTTNGGAAWSEVSRDASGDCKLNSGNGNPITDIAAVTGSDSVYFIKQGFGGMYFTSDALASPPSTRGESVNCFDERPSLAVDTASSNRLVAGDRCTGSLSVQYSEDGGSNFKRTRLVPDTTPVNGIDDVAFAGGTALWVGNGGDIFNSTDGRNAYVQRADGVDAARGWRAVSAYSATNAAVAGVGGALVVTLGGEHDPRSRPAGRHDQRAHERHGRGADRVHRERRRQRRRLRRRPRGLPVERSGRRRLDEQPGEPRLPERRVLLAEGHLQGPRRQPGRGDARGHGAARPPRTPAGGPSRCPAAARSR